MHGAHLGFEIKQTVRLINRRICRSATMSYANELTGTHAWILNYLNENKDKDMFQRDIEKKFDLRRSSATGLLQLMEKNGLIRREPVPYDARLKRIIMTDKAVSLHRAIDEDINQMERQIENGLSEEEIQQLLMLLKRIQHNLSDEQEEGKTT